VHGWSWNSDVAEALDRVTPKTDSVRHARCNTDGMLNTQSWDRFVHASPGRRFQERYRRMQREKGSAWRRCAFVCAGIVLSIVGLFFLAVPGPGIPILAIGLALIAQESAVLARFLDRAELRLRRWWKRLRS
jgi:hypothetical protein